MKRLPVSSWAWVAPLLFGALAQLARADGGTVLLSETQGSFSVTVFVSPEAAYGGRSDVSVLVQRSTNREVILDADVRLVVDSPAGVSTATSDPFCGLPSTGETVPATREQASNKLLYAAGLNLNVPGDWRLHIYVSCGSDRARFDCLLPVTRTSTTLSGLWPYLAFPPIVITAFAINQRLRRHSLENAVESQSPTVCGV
jgi:hypothetical protein